MNKFEIPVYRQADEYRHARGMIRLPTLGEARFPPEADRLWRLAAGGKSDTRKS